MKFVERLSTLIKADAHGVVESLEDRRLLAKQFVRDANLALNERREALLATRREEEHLKVQGQRLSARLTRHDQDVTLAMQQEQYDLARAAIRKLLQLKAALAQLQERQHCLQEQAAREASGIATQEQELETLKARLLTELQTMPAAVSDEFNGTLVVTDHDVEFELLRRHETAESAPPLRGDA